MTQEQYLIALKKLGLPPYGRRIAEVLGLSTRQADRLAAGYPATETIALLLDMYLRHGVPDTPSVPSPKRRRRHRPYKRRRPVAAPEPAAEIPQPVSPMPSKFR